MGKLYQLIEKQINIVKEYADQEKNDYINAKIFSKTYTALSNAVNANILINEVNRNPEGYFESKQAFLDFIKANENVVGKEDLSEIPIMGINEHKFKKIIDYETLLNNLEASIGEEKTNALINEYQNISTRSNINEVLKPYTDDIKKDIDTLALDSELSKKYKDDLDYISKSIIEKKTAGVSEDAIEEISVARDFDAFKHIDEFAQKNNLDPVKLKAINNSNVKVDFSKVDKDNADYVKSYGFNGVKYSDELKNKLLGLEAKIKELGVPKEYPVGEEGLKYYGLIDYFEKGKEITELVGTYKDKTTNEEKLAHIQEISRKKEELAEIENKYDQLFAYIKENFDLDNITLSGNIYSGRVHEFDPNYVSQFTPNLPEKWDNENSGITAILNGFCQFKGAALNANVSTEEYMEKPVETFLKGAYKNAEQTDERYYLKRSDENSLGKRMAHAMIMVESSHAQVTGYILSARGIEFLNCVDKKGEHNIQNNISTNIGTNLGFLFEHSTQKMFMNGANPDYDSIKNMIAMGDKTDKLYELSENYFDKDIKRGPKINYKGAVTHGENANRPTNELNRVLNTLKDYVVERDAMVADPLRYFTEDDQIQESVQFTSVLLSAKKYFNDYLEMNNIDLLNLPKNEQKEIMNFINDPAGVMTKKYKDELDLSDESVVEFQRLYKEENRRANASKIEEFNTKFNSHNNIEHGRNTGKSIERIMKDNRGGFLERNFGWSSKEYKALKKAVKAANDPSSPTYGDQSNSKFFAKKYLDHKVPLGTDESRLSATEKARVDFCRSLIATCDEMEKKNDVANDINNIDLNKNNNIIDNEFSKQVEKDVDLDKVKEDDIVVNVESNEIKNDIELDK